MKATLANVNKILKKHNAKAVWAEQGRERKRVKIVMNNTYSWQDENSWAAVGIFELDNLCAGFEDTTMRRPGYGSWGNKVFDGWNIPREGREDLVRVVELDAEELKAMKDAVFELVMAL